MEIIVGKSAGFCFGVDRAVNATKEEIKKETVYCLGEIVHNQNVIETLKQLGVKFIENIEEAKGKTIIRAHGVPKKIYDKAKEKGISIVDLTCPSVLKIHKIVEEYAKNNYYIVLTGKSNHPEVIGIVSHCGEKYQVIGEKSEIPMLIEKIKNEKNVLLISQTTYSSKKFSEIEDELKSKISKNINLEVRKTICPSTELRQNETEEIAKKVDIMIIIGDKRSSNTNKLYDISCNICKNVLFISNASELDCSKISKNEKIGIMAGASTPKEDILKVKELLLQLK